MWWPSLWCPRPEENNTEQEPPTEQLAQTAAEDEGPQSKRSRNWTRMMNSCSSTRRPYWPKQLSLQTPNVSNITATQPTSPGPLVPHGTDGLESFTKQSFVPKEGGTSLPR